MHGGSRRLAQAGLAMYFPGSAIAWLLFSGPWGWHSSARFGATLALIGLVVALWSNWSGWPSKWFVVLVALLVAAVPIAILTWANGADAGTAWQVLFKVVGGVVGLYLVVIIVQRLNRWTST